MNYLKNMINKARYKKIKEEMIDLQYDYLKGFSLIGSIMGIILLFVSLFFGDDFKYRLPLFFVFLSFLFCLIISKFIEKKKSLSIYITYLVCNIVMIIALLLGTVLDKESPAVLVIMFICVFPMFIIDNHLHVFLFTTFWSVLLLVLISIYKTGSVRADDITRIVIFYILSVGANTMILESHILRMEKQKELVFQATFDALTGIYNRGTGVSLVEKQVEAGVVGTLIMIDIDSFKTINDINGHQAGDFILKEFATYLHEITPKSGICLRLGGDEFAVFIKNLIIDNDVLLFIDKICKFNGLHKFENVDIDVKVSGGAVIYTNSSKTFQELYKDVDLSLYEAKNTGKNKFILKHVN